MRFSPFSPRDTFFEGVYRRWIEYPGVDEMFVYETLPFSADGGLRQEKVVLYVLVGGNSYAFTWEADTNARRKWLSTVLRSLDAGDSSHFLSSPMHALMEQFFSREECLSESRELLLAEAWSEVDGRGEARVHPPPDGDAGFLSSLLLKVEAAPGERVRLRFRLIENVTRTYVDRVEELDGVPAAGAKGRMSSYAEGTRLDAVSDEDGALTFDLGPLRSGGGWRFLLHGSGGGGREAGVTGEVLFRDDWSSWRSSGTVVGFKGLPRTLSGEDMLSVLLEDVHSCYDTDRDVFLDPVAGAPLPRDWRIALVLASSQPDSPRFASFLSRCMERLRERAVGGDPAGEDALGMAYVLGSAAAEPLRSLACGLGDRMETRVERRWCSRVWTEEDAFLVLETCTAASVLLERMPADEGCTSAARSVLDSAECFLARVEREVEPSFFHIQPGRPMKLFCAVSEPSAPHGIAVLALLAASRLAVRSGDAEAGRRFRTAAGEQAGHLLRRHGFHDEVPKLFRVARKETVDYSPLLWPMEAFKTMGAAEPAMRSCCGAYEEYRNELVRTFSEWYEHTSLEQRVWMIRALGDGCLPWFVMPGGDAWRPAGAAEPACGHGAADEPGEGGKRACRRE